MDFRGVGSIEVWSDLNDSFCRFSVATVFDGCTKDTRSGSMEETLDSDNARWRRDMATLGTRLGTSMEGGVRGTLVSVKDSSENVTWEVDGDVGGVGSWAC